MTLTDAQRKALDKLPLTCIPDETNDGVQWRTIEKLHQEGLVIFEHRNMSREDEPHLIEVTRIPGEG